MGRGLGEAGPAVASRPTLSPRGAGPAGVRSERAAELGPSLGHSDPAMASLLPLLCLCVAAAHLAGARGEAPPGPQPIPLSAERLAAGLACSRAWRENQGTIRFPRPRSPLPALRWGQ